MPRTATATLQPRKTPVQARSTVTVEAILDAAIQVLVAVGKERLTTTQVALRAGVSVGTLYQYFPNKTALLRTCLKRHMDEVSAATLGACERSRHGTLLQMADCLIDAFLAAKMHDVKASVTLYAVSSDIDGAALSKAVAARALKAVAALLATAQEGLAKEPELVAAAVLAALNGVARRVLEARSPERELPALRRELTVMVRQYLRTCSASPLLEGEAP